MKGKYCIFLLFILVALISCNDPKPVTNTLHRAEALMNEYPDSAWTLLNTISPDEMEQNRNRALYALLYTQAQDKTYQDETNDSLISIAVDYYRDTDDVRHKFLSYYYKGRVMMNAGESIKAMLSFLEAESLCEDVNDGYLLGLLYTQMGDIYKNYYDYPRSLEMFQKATACYEQAGKDLHYLYALVDQANVYKNMGKNEDAFKLLQFVLKEGEQKNYRGLIKSSLGDLIMLCVKLKNWNEADLLIQKFQRSYDMFAMSSSFLADIAEIHAMKKEWNISQEVLRKAWQRTQTENDTIVLYFTEARIHEIRNPQSETYYSMLEGLKKQSHSIRRSMEQPVLTAQRDYLSEKLEFEAYKLRMRKLLNLVSILFFLLLLGVTVYVFVRLFRKHKKESRQVISDLENRNNRIEEEKGKIALALQQLDEDKRKADRTIANLKEEIEKKKEEGNAKIADLKTKLQQEQQSVEGLMQTLNDVIAQKEEDRQSMETLVQQLEKDSAVNAESMLRLRLNLESQEKEYRLYVQKAEAEAKALQDENRKLMFQKVELLKNVLEHVAGVVFLHEAKYPKEETKEKKIKEGISLLRKNYFAGDNEYQKVEVWVNLYLDNVMSHFRKEVSLANESEYRRVCYMFAGVSGQVIGGIMQESKDVVYQRRSRLLKKIGSLSCKHKEMFIVLLSK